MADGKEQGKVISSNDACDYCENKSKPYKQGCRVCDALTHDCFVGKTVQEIEKK